MKKIFSLVCLAAFVCALGASVGCEEKKTSATTTPKAGSGSGSGPAGAGSSSKAGT